MMEKIDMDYKRAIVFYEQKLPVHISLVNGSFYNGLITEKPTQEFFFINDKVEGKTLIFFIELKKPIQEFNNKEVKN